MCKNNYRLRWKVTTCDLPFERVISRFALRIKYFIARFITYWVGKVCGRGTINHCEIISCTSSQFETCIGLTHTYTSGSLTVLKINHLSIIRVRSKINVKIAIVLEYKCVRITMQILTIILLCTTFNLFSNQCSRMCECVCN